MKVPTKMSKAEYKRRMKKLHELKQICIGMFSGQQIGSVNQALFTKYKNELELTNEDISRGHQQFIKARKEARGC